MFLRLAAETLELLGESPGPGLRFRRALLGRAAGGTFGFCLLFGCTTGGALRLDLLLDSLDLCLGSLGLRLPLFIGEKKASGLHVGHAK